MFFYYLGLAFPPPDDAVHVYVVTSALATGTTFEDIENFYLCFFASLFSKINHELQEYHAKQQKGTKTLAGWWRDHLRQLNTRQELYSDVIDGAAGFGGNTVSRMTLSIYM